MVLDHLIHSYTALDDPFHLEYEYIRLYEELVRWQTEEKQSFKAFSLVGRFHLSAVSGGKIPGSSNRRRRDRPGGESCGQDVFGDSGEHADSHLQYGRAVVRDELQGERHYDFIFGDAFNDLSIPYHLTTREFAMELKRLLKPMDSILPM